ncbi:hypothetical protein AVW15_12495 [Chelatococcus daeguensis]|nr:hypothetical protein AVW15_12495 [Chelatococcus daeguensis]
MGDAPSPARQIGDEMQGGHDFEHQQFRHRRQRMRVERQGREPRPRPFDDDVLEEIYDEFADARRAIDMRDDLEREVRLDQRGPHGIETGAAMLVAYHSGRHAHADLVGADLAGRDLATTFH